MVPEIHRIEGVVLSMYARDHPPGHIHADSAEHQAVISLETCDLEQGFLPYGKRKKVCRWIAEHREELNERWRSLTGR